MNPELLSQLKEYLEASESFVVQQAPLVAQEVILAGRLQSSLALGASVVALVLFAFVAVKAMKIAHKGRENCELFFLGGGVGIIGAGFSLLGIALNAHWAILSWFAPRMYVLQELSDLL